MRLIRLAVAVLIGSGLLADPAAASTRGQTVNVSGNWYNAGPCVPTGVVPDPQHVGEGTITCDGSSVWTGSWSGVTDFALVARGNLVTDKIKGSLTEIFVGTGTKGAGTMTFHERFALAN